jgi:hypothetical protein
MTALVLILSGVAAGDGGTRAGAATAPVAVDLGGRWVGTYQAEGRKPQAAELSGGVLRVMPARFPFHCRFTARPGGGLEGTVVLVPDAPIGNLPAIYKLERGRLVICCSQTNDLPTAFAVTRTTGLLTLKPADSRKP